MPKARPEARRPTTSRSASVSCARTNSSGSGVTNRWSYWQVQLLETDDADPPGARRQGTPLRARARGHYDARMTDARELHDGREDGPRRPREPRPRPGEVLLLPAPGHVEDRLQRPLARRGLRRDRGHGEGPRLQGGAHPLRRHDHREDGQGHLQDDRHRHGAGGRLDRRPHGPRHVRGGRPHPLPPRPDGVGRGALREGLQPRLRHAGDGVEPQLRRGVHLEGARPPRRRAASSRARSSTARSARCWPRTPGRPASCAART